MDASDTKRIMRKFLNNLMPVNLTAHLHGVNTLLERHMPPKISQEETDNMNGSPSVKEIKCIVKNLPLKTITGPEGFTRAFYQTCKEEIMPICSDSSNKEEVLPRVSTCDQEQDGFLLSSCPCPGG